MVLHVLNSAAGGAALSTIDLIKALGQTGISACAVCHDAGNDAEREQLRAATDGRTLFTSLYWWNRKIRAALWKRPLIELRQIVKTGWMRRSTAAIMDFAQRHAAELIHTMNCLARGSHFAWLVAPRDSHDLFGSTPRWSWQIPKLAP
jgi:hypothetical protein